jgi:hypothetical protein
MKNTITTLIANLNNGLYSSDNSFIAKQVAKGGEHFAQLLPLLATSEQLQAMNQKGVKRFVQAVNFALSGNVKDFDAVTAYMISAIVLTKDNAISFQNAHFLCGLNTDNAQNVKGISRAKFSRFLGNAGTAKTITSKVSRTTGKGGFFTALNITAKSNAHGFELTESAKNNALILSYAKQLENMTDGAFNLIQSDKKSA